MLVAAHSATSQVTVVLLLLSRALLVCVPATGGGVPAGLTIKAASMMEAASCPTGGAQRPRPSSRTRCACHASLCTLLFCEFVCVTLCRERLASTFGRWQLTHCPRSCLPPLSPSGVCLLRHDFGSYTNHMGLMLAPFPAPAWYVWSVCGGGVGGGRGGA